MSEQRLVPCCAVPDEGFRIWPGPREVPGRMEAWNGMGWDGGWERGQPLAQVILVFMRKQTHASLDLTHTLEVSFSDYT